MSDQLLFPQLTYNTLLLPYNYEKEDMLDWLDAQIGEGDAVLFKGSNSMKLGETAARFISVEKTPTSSGGE